MAAKAAEGTDDVAGPARPVASIELGERSSAHPRGPVGDEHTQDEARPISATVRPPDHVTDLAAACARFVATRYGARLDYRPETLSFVDQWVRDARCEIRDRPEAADLVQRSAGAYLGEVIRRALGGQWIAEGDPRSWRLFLSQVYCAFNPVGMVREALLLDSAEGWCAHFELDPGEQETVERRLCALPEVGADEFYAPSTRFDVVQILFESLRAAMRSRGLAEVTFGPEDYR